MILNVTMEEFLEMKHFEDLEKQDGLSHLTAFCRNRFGIHGGSYAVRVVKEVKKRRTND